MAYRTIRRLPGDHESIYDDSSTEWAPEERTFARIVDRLVYPELSLTLSTALASPSTVVKHYAAQNINRIWR